MVEKSALDQRRWPRHRFPKLRELCREWATENVDLQREGFKRLGVNADWEHPYLTYTPDYEAGNVELFRDTYMKGSIYRGRKPIHWCMNCHTALAEAGIAYGDETSPSIFVAFKLDSVPGVFEAAGVEGDAYVLIWTTTPWTLPANTAVSLAPDADYVMVDAAGKQMLMAEELVESVAEIAGWDGYSLATSDGDPVRIKGKQLCGLTYTAPIRQDLKGTVIYGGMMSPSTRARAPYIPPPGMARTTTSWRWSSTCRCSCPSMTTACSPTKRGSSRGLTSTTPTRR